jgi:DNA mismatch endonuclease (patch repair protein)
MADTIAQKRTFDHVSPAVHKSMQGNKRANTKPELVMRQRLRDAGLTGYRLQWKVPGRPDVAWPGKKVAIFVNGCFWHRCPRCNLALPKSHVEYWTQKFARNVERDKRNLNTLHTMGWTTHVVWECQLKKKEIDATFAELLPQLAAELHKPLRPEAIAYYAITLPGLPAASAGEDGRAV